MPIGIVCIIRFMGKQYQLTGLNTWYYIFDNSLCVQTGFAHKAPWGWFFRKSNFRNPALLPEPAKTPKSFQKRLAPRPDISGRGTALWYYWKPIGNLTGPFSTFSNRHHQLLGNGPEEGNEEKREWYQTVIHDFVKNRLHLRCGTLPNGDSKMAGLSVFRWQIYNTLSSIYE